MTYFQHNKQTDCNLITSDKTFGLNLMSINGINIVNYFEIEKGESKN